MIFSLRPGQLTFANFRELIDKNTSLILDDECHAKIKAAQQVIHRVVAENKTVYGVNTGFGALASTGISSNELASLQRKLILSHAAGTGELLDDDIVRLILALKINSLARGYSGVSLETIDALLRLYNKKIYPCIPAQGSVGASGDLAPLAHLSALLLGFGEARHEGQIISAELALAKAELNPLQLGPKEGLALLNGTQVSTALAIDAWLKTETLFTNAIITGALSVDAMRASHIPFDARIQAIRGQEGQIIAAKIFCHLLARSEIPASHHDCNKVQDPYSLRCQPQVMGACLSHLLFTQSIFLNEANGVSDNPLIFAEQNEILSGGNFHAEPIALAADTLALAIAEIAALSERRIALMMDPHFSGLPAFLVKEAGINSGFMMAQVTAAALASENKSLAHPASVDSIPTSMNQEDHVSMATYAARRLLSMTENAAAIIGIELLAACQALDFLRPLKTSVLLEEVHRLVRAQISFYESDRYFAPDIARAKALVQSGALARCCQLDLI